MPIDAQPPEPTGWVTAEVAANQLGLAINYVRDGHRNGRFPVTRHDGESWLRSADVEQLVRARRIEEERWVARLVVEAWAECSDGPVVAAIRSGRIKQRPGPRTRGMPSLERQSALAWAQEYREERARRDQRHAQRQAQAGPPDDVHVWLNTSTAAAIVGMTPRNLVRLAQLSRAPATKRAQRWWWRRDLVEAYAAARVAASTNHES